MITLRGGWSWRHVVIKRLAALRSQSSFSGPSLDNRLGHERNDCALIGVHERGAQHLVRIGDGAMVVMRFQTESQ
jgi:hypothetical protein